MFRAAVGKENVHDWFSNDGFQTDCRDLRCRGRDGDAGVSQARAAPGIKVAMAVPMHADGKMVRHGKRHMSHHAAAKDTAKHGDRYGMK